MQAFEIQRFDGGGDPIQQVERPDPVPGHGQVAVDIRAVSLNFRDLLMISGKYNPRLKLPLIPCSDGAGVVSAIGAGVTRWKLGERVLPTFFQGWLDGEPTEARTAAALGGDIDGVLAKRVVVDEDGVVATPGHLTDEEAATLPCAALTAWNALFGDAPVVAGQTVLTQGTGGVSIFALQFAKLAGARVIVTSSRDEKLAKCATLGADHGINYVSEPAWEDRARSLSGGQGVDHVVELGGAGTLGKSFKAVRVGGRISLIGVLSGGAGEVNPVPILMRSIRVRGIYVGSVDLFEAMNRAITAHQLRPVVDRVFDFDDAAKAFAYMASGQHFGKVVIRVG